MCVCVRACVRACVHTYVCVCARVRAYVCVCVCVRACVHAWVGGCVSSCMHFCMCVHVYFVCVVGVSERKGVSFRLGLMWPHLSCGRGGEAWTIVLHWCFQGGMYLLSPPKRIIKLANLRKHKIKKNFSKLQQIL